MCLSVSTEHICARFTGNTAAVEGDALTELLLDLAFEELHFCRLAVYQQHVSRLCHSNELHDALCICMCTEGHVLHLQFHVQLTITEKWIAN